MGRDATATNPTDGPTKAPTGGPTAPLVDDLTLARAMRGEPDAFRVVVERHEGAVFALIGRIIGRRRGQGLVEELAQETFVRVFHALPNFGRTGRWNLTAWILTIATRLCIDELRRHPAAEEPLTRAHDQADERQSAEVDAERRRIALAISRAVDDLSGEQRAAFVLREVHGLEYEAIAEALGIDIGTVRSRLSRARAALRAALSGLYDEK
jgi:RNA polymerase sigma-70 factor, ECF subfamily